MNVGIAAIVAYVEVDGTEGKRREACSGRKGRLRLSEGDQTGGRDLKYLPAQLKGR